MNFGILSLGLLSLCLALLVGIARMVRKLNLAKSELERKTQELSGNIGHLKTEIAERRLIETALRASENFYSSLIETVPQSIFRKDLAGKYTFVNRAFCTSLGKTSNEIMSKTDHDLFPDDLAARFQREEEKSLATGKQVESEQECPIGARGRICVRMINSPLFDSSGRPIGVQGIFWEVTERKHAGKELESVHRQLIEAARQVGMAEVATGVLHNVGNVLNSVNVSATLVSEQLKESLVPAVGKAAALLSEHADDEKFLTQDPRGKELPGYLKDLAEHLRKEQAAMREELCSLVKYIEHIKEIVFMQQAYAKLSGLSVAVRSSDIVEDALRMNSSALTRHGVHVVRDYQDAPTIIVDKNKVMQILINLIRNAKYACDESGRSNKQIKVRIGRNGNERIAIKIADNGVGISSENMSRIFTRGFTTRTHGHGFGLHSCLLAAREMGGVLTVHSDGPDLGAIFTLDLPCQPEGNSK
jgi:PAS domain S-box-containing protein